MRDCPQSFPTIQVGIGSLPGILAHMKKISRIFWGYLALACATGCGEEPTTELPTRPTSSLPSQPEVGEISGTVSISSEILPLWPTGSSTWSWTAPGREEGSAQLVMLPFECPTKVLKYQWSFHPSIPPRQTQTPINLIPDNPIRWLPMRFIPPSGPGNWPAIPLPRIPMVSEAYGNLIDFLKQITANQFTSTICHWPGLPVPVRPGMAQSDDLDLSGCLVEAVHIWNEQAPRPWFKIEPDATWGVRMVHFPGAILRPPLEARITRLDSLGNPLRINIVVGDNYDGPEDREYAVRGFVHELGHTLFLWGHSQDRNHILWGAGPPLVDGPSQDERKAAQLWHGLPEGLDLNNYLSGP